MLSCNDFIQLLVGCEAQRIDIHSVPVVENSANLYIQASGGDGLDENSSAFKFTPQRIRLDIDDEMFANNNLNRSLQKAESLDNIKLQSGKICGISTFQGQKASRHMDGDVHRHMYLQDLVTPLTEESPALNIAEFQCHIAGCKQLFDTLEGYEHHYNSLHRHVCSSCKRSFPSNRLLDIHILEWHDSLFQVMAERESMYQCLVEGCGLKFQDSKERKEHLVTTHSYPSDFRFDKTKKIKRGTKEEKFPQQKKLDNCEDMDFSLPQETESHNHDLPERQKPHYSYKVPPIICFGHGSVRGFRGGRKKK